MIIVFCVWEECGFELPSAVLVRAVQLGSRSSRNDSKEDDIAASDILSFLGNSITKSEVVVSRLLSSHCREMLEYIRTKFEDQVV